MFRLLTLLISFLISLNAVAQNTSIGITALPSISNFHYENKIAETSYIFNFNYGVRASFERGNFLFSTGILNMGQGTKFEVVATTEDDPQGTGETFDVFLRTKTLMLPLNVDYIFASTKHTRFFVGPGLYLGYLYFQQQEDTHIPEDFTPSPPATTPYPERYRDLSIFNDFYIGVNAGIGMKHAISEKLHLQLRPNVLYQLRKNDDSEEVNTISLMSFAVDIGLYYQL